MPKKVLHIPAITKKNHGKLIEKLVNLPNKIVNLKTKQEIINKLSKPNANQDAIKRIEDLVEKSYNVALKLKKSGGINCKKHVGLCRK